MKKRLLIATTVLLASAGLYGYVWSRAATHLELAILDQGKILEEKGYRLSHGAIHVKGFPFQLKLDIDNVMIEAPAPLSTSFALKGVLHGSASLWAPSRVTFTCADGIEIKTTLLKEGNNTVLKADGFDASMPFPTPLEDLSITFKNAHIGAVDLKIQALKLGFAIHENDADQDVYSLEATNLDPGHEIFSGFPQIIQNLTGHLSFKGHVLMNMPLDKAVAKWYENDGVVDIGQFSITWGDLKLNTNGTLAVDHNLQPLAAFAAEIYGLDPFLDKASDLGFIHKNLLPILKMSLNLLKETKPGSTPDKPQTIYHKVAITIQDNDVVIGSIPIMKLTPINWPKLGA